MATTKAKPQAAKPLDEAKADETTARAQLSEALATGEGVKAAQDAYATAAAEVEKARLAEEHRQREAERKQREAEQQRQAENRERVQLQAAEFRKAAGNLHTKLQAFLEAFEPTVQELSKLRQSCNQAGLPMPPRSEPESLYSELYKTIVLHPNMRGFPDPHSVRTTLQAQEHSVKGWAERMETVLKSWTEPEESDNAA